MEIVAALDNTAKKFRKELLMIPYLGLREHVLQYMTFYPNINWKEVIGQLSGNYQLRPHNGNKNLQTGFKADAREIEVFIGDCVAEENPEDIRKSILGSDMLDSTQPNKHPMALKIMSVIMDNISRGLTESVWNAVRDAGGTTTADLFNGFDTITGTEIGAGKITVALGNKIEIATAIDDTNAMDIATEIYRKANKNLRNIPTVMFCDYAFYDAAQQQMIDNGYSTTSGGDKDTFMYVLGSDKKCLLVPQVGKSGSSYIHLTKKPIMQVATDVATDSATLKVREADNPFVAQIVTKMGFGVQFSSIQKEDLFVAEVTPMS